MNIGFGFPDQWEHFAKTYPVFTEKLGALHKTIESVIAREGESKSLADTVIFFLGRLCAEDFSEILLMCANGYGFGAMRLLRSMYERTVTLAYLSKYPTQVNDFWDYHLVTQRKVMNRLEDVEGEAEVEKMLGRKAMDEVENDFQKIKARFMNGKNLQISWTKKTMEQLVKDAGKEYRELYVACYVMPLLQAHPSASSIMNRLEDVGGVVNFDMKSSTGIVVWPLICAHNLVLRVVDLHNDYFKLGVDDEIKERADDFLACWKQ
jgi:Family of unknown function (DUF5677)